MASLKVRCAQQQYMVDLLIMEKDKTYQTIMITTCG